MNNFFRRGEISTIVVAGALIVVGVATFLSTTLNKTQQTVNTKAQTPIACPYDSGISVALGQTESDAQNMEARWPISEHRHEYDFFSYFVPATFQEARDSKMSVYPKDQYLTYAEIPPGGMDTNLTGMMGKMFGYKPTKLNDAYFMKYNSVALQGKDTLVKGISPALSVPVQPGYPVYMPDTLYSIGGNMEAMVVFAASDRITLHLGRHEYLVGSGNNCNGKRCSGGIWLYIKGICVDNQILAKYNEVKAAQESAQADKISITLPMVEAGKILGKATGSSVEVIMRDNGPLMSIHKPGFWEGVPVKDVTIVEAATSTPTPTPTFFPTVTQTLPSSVQAPTLTFTPTPTFNTPTSIPLSTNAPESRSISEPGRIDTYSIELTADVVAKQCPEDLNNAEGFCILLRK